MQDKKTNKGQKRAVEAQSTNLIQRLEEDVKTSIFNVIYILLKDFEISLWKYIAIVIIDFLQILYYSFAPCVYLIS